MLPSAPYDPYPEYDHGSALSSLNFGLPSGVREMARQNDYGYMRQYPQSAEATLVHQAAYRLDSQIYTSSVKMAQTQSSSNAHGPANVPTLPPLRAPDQSLGQQPRSQEVSANPQQQPKEEKVGGVAAHLDYKMDEMVNFVSEMAQGMYAIFASKICLADIDMTRSVINSKTSVHPDLRRYVNQILTSTRLPSSTILLGLHYLAVRLTMLSGRGNHGYGGGGVYNLLTTALLLGSKFLDDNTFQNRSWSDVSKISVRKLNAFESEWLQDIKWDLHFDPSDPKGFALWRRRWQIFRDAPQCKNLDVLVETMKRTSIDSGFQQQLNIIRSVPSIDHHGSQYPESHTAGHHQGHSTPQYHGRRYSQWISLRSDCGYSPPSAPDTEPHTPDYAMSNGFGYGTLPSIYPLLKMPAPLPTLPSNAPGPGYLAPHYNHYAGHGSYCVCSYCTPHNDRYAVHHAFDQAVVG